MKLKSSSRSHAQRTSGGISTGSTDEVPAIQASLAPRRNGSESVTLAGLAGLEPPTRPLWRDAPAPRTPQWDIFDWPGQEERACDVGSTVDTSMAVPEPGVFRASGSGAPAWRH